MALVDNDVMEKLALLDLFEQFRALDVCSDGVLLLTTARFRYRKGRPPKNLAKKYGEVARDRVVAVSQNEESIPGTTALLPDLVGIHDVDEGEVGLFSAAMSLTTQHVLTGDKRCIRGLAQGAQDSPAVAAIVDALAGRVMCLEQVMWALVEQFDTDTIADRVKKMPQIDGSLKMIFGAQDTKAAFRSYISEVRRDAAGMLHPLEP